MSQQLKGLALVEDLGWVPSIHLGANNHLNLQFLRIQHSLLAKGTAHDLVSSPNNSSNAR